MIVKISELEKIGKKILLKYGYSNDEATSILEALMYAQLRGSNQGLVKLLSPSFGKNLKARKDKIVKQTKLSALLNGGLNSGIVILRKATKIAIKKAQSNGLAIVGTNHTNTSTGALGFYAREIAKKGLVGMVFAGPPPNVATHGSYQPTLGTNPIAIGVPGQKPIVLDMATSAIPYYGLVEAKTRGEKIAKDLAYDNNGKPTDDPAAALEGAIRVFDRSYKGSGLSFMVQVLGGLLVGAEAAKSGSKNWGNLVLVIDPKLFGSKDVFTKQVSSFGTKVKSSKRLPGIKELFLPGERGDREAERQLRSGKVEIEKNLYAGLLRISKS